MYEVVYAEYSTKDYLESLKLRIDIFVGELGGNISTEVSEEERCIYTVLKDKDICVATARINPISNKDARIERVCVHRDYRGRGIGNILIESIEKKICQMMFERAFIYARDTAVEFYKSMGYRTFGNKFLRDGVVHIRMVKNIK